MSRHNFESPHLERGYTRIANGLLEGILEYPFTGGELKLVLAVIRSTYGWGRKERVLSVSDLAGMTDLCDRHAKRLIQRLARDQVLIKRPITRLRVVMSLNKEFSTWRLRKTWVDSDVPNP